jgi:ribosomal protein S18 acetylase RimI-like enzyme
MTLTPRDPAGVTGREAAGDADLAAAVGVQHRAYAGPSPGPEDIARIRTMTARGGVVTVAVDDESGSVAGTGLVDVPAPESGTGELAAVGVLTAFRRRGIASAVVSAHLARIAHARGIKVVFLEALPDEEEIYRRTGFADASVKVWLSLR